MTVRLVLGLACVVAMAMTKPSTVDDARTLENRLYEMLELKQSADGSLSNTIGTPCSADLSGAALDILIAIDSTANQDALDKFTTTMIKQLSRLSLLGNKLNGSCVGIFTYNTAATYKNYIGNCDNFGGVFDTLYHNVKQTTYNQVANLNIPLTIAYQIFSKRSVRKQVLIIGSSQGADSKSNAVALADDLKEQFGVFVLGVTLEPTDDDLRSSMVDVVSPGQLFGVFENDFDKHFTKAFAYANCRCPRKLTQLAIYNSSSNHIDFYADCFEVIATPTNSFIASKACKDKGGSLVAVTSQEKFDFLQEVVVAAQLPNAANYLIGLFRQRNKSLVWEYYDNSLVSLGDFQKWSTDSAPKGGFCGYMTNFVGSQFGFSMGICNERFPYVCQIRACDAQNIC